MGSKSNREHHYFSHHSASAVSKLKLRLLFGLTEIAGLELDGPKMLNGWTLQDRNMTDQLSGLDFAGLESSFLHGNESSLYKRRRFAHPVLPASVLDAADIISNSRYAKVGDEMFYRGTADAGNNGTALVFASEKQLELLKLSSRVYYDATFKIVPRMYYQLFTIFVPHSDATFPVFYALVSRKTQALYYAIFTKIRSLLPDFKPVCVMADFEEASAAAFIDVFGENITISGCWLHYAQAIIKRIQKNGLNKESYMSDNYVQATVHRLLSLPLLPPGEIVAGLEDICLAISSDGQFPEKLYQLITYIQRQ